MTNSTKITKRDNFAALRSLIETSTLANDEQDRLLAFIDHEVEQLDKRTASARKYAKKGNAANDVMTDHILTILEDSDAPLTIGDIVNALIAENADCGATSSKVSYRLTQLVKAGRADKETISIKVEGQPTRKVNGYSLNADYVDAVTDEDEE